MKEAKRLNVISAVRGRKALVMAYVGKDLIVEKVTSPQEDALAKTMKEVEREALGKVADKYKIVSIKWTKA